MSLFTRVLVAVDFSDFSRQALRVAAELAEKFACRVLVLHVCNTPRAVDPAVLAGQDKAIKSLIELRQGAARVARQRLAEWVAQERWGHGQVEQEVLTGVPYKVITERARSFSADLIVMGSYGRSGFVRMLIGSTTEKVLRKCDTAVLAVSTHDSAGRAESQGDDAQK